MLELRMATPAHRLVARYIETIDRLYTEKTFILSAIVQFPSWVDSIPHRHQCLVRHLVLYFGWTDFLVEDEVSRRIVTALGRLTGLRTLRVILDQNIDLYFYLRRKPGLLRHSGTTVLYYVEPHSLGPPHLHWQLDLMEKWVVDEADGSAQAGNLYRSQRSIILPKDGFLTKVMSFGWWRKLLSRCSARPASVVRQKRHRNSHGDTTTATRNRWAEQTQPCASVVPDSSADSTSIPVGVDSLSRCVPMAPHSSRTLS
jgi:hypothetical protein